MEILFHLGAHCTDGGLLIRSILRNRNLLSREGIFVPGPGRYRELLGEVSTTLRGEVASADTESMLLDAIGDDTSADRLILSNENFLCRDTRVLEGGTLYPRAAKAAWLAKCFPSHRAEFALAIRNPATFVPDVIARTTNTAEERNTVLSGLELDRILWSDVIDRLQQAVPDARIVVWCHEDTPLIWPEIQRELTQHDPFTRLEGALDMAERIISEDGMLRLNEFLDARSDLTEARRRAAIGAFLEAHALEDRIATEIDLPGWTDETVTTLTEAYEDDLEEIARRPGVASLAP